MTVGWDNVDLRTEVKKALFGNTTQTVTDLTDFFDADVINKWSKYKPVISPELFIDADVWEEEGYRGSDGHCGLQYTEYTTANRMKNAFDNDSSGIYWDYEVPTGGTTEPMRLGDFRGYCSTAYAPIGDAVTNGIMDSDGYVTFDVEDVLDGNDSENLTFRDFRVGGQDGDMLEDMYLGIYMTDGSARRFQTAEDTVWYGGTEVSIWGGEEGDWQYAPFLSTSYQNGETDKAGTFVSCGIPLQDITIESSGGGSGSGYDAYVSEAYWSGTNQISARIIIDNTSTADKAFTGLYLYVYGANTLSAVLNGQGELMNGSGTLVTTRTIVSAGDMYESSAIKITNINQTKYKYYGILLSCNSPEFITDITPVEDDPTEL